MPILVSPSFDRLTLAIGQRGLAEVRLGVLIMLHDPNLAALYADRLLALHDGGLAAVGPPGEILDHAVLRRVFDVALPVRRRQEGGTPFVLPERPGHDGTTRFTPDRAILF